MFGYLNIGLRWGVSLFFVGLLHLPWAIELSHLLQPKEVHIPCEEQAIHFHEACIDCELFDCLLPITYTLHTSKSTPQYQFLAPVRVKAFLTQQGFTIQPNTRINGLRGPPQGV